MNFIEITEPSGDKMLYDFDSGWEIRDKGDEPAHWGNYREGRNIFAQETYAEIRQRVLQPLLNTGESQK